jgi:hypothetical protein
MPEARLQRADLIEKSLRDARALGMIDQAPQHNLISFEPDSQFIQLVLESLRVERASALMHTEDS